MGTRRLAGTAVTLILALTTGGCFSEPLPRQPLSRPEPPPLVAPPALTAHPVWPVGVRVLDLQRGPNRPLPTLVFYPAATRPDQAELTNRRHPQPADGLFALASHPNRATPPKATRTDNAGQTSGAGRTALTTRTDNAGRGELSARVGGSGWAELARAGHSGRVSRPVPADLVARVAASARVGLAPANGRFPLVLFSHGLSGSPERYAPVLAAFAAAGFVVAAPTYPNTSEFAVRFRRADIVRQPADARYVLSRVLRLNYTAGDPLWHRIDAEHLAAVGHSAGGYTTTGLFTAGHDPRLRAGVVMAGWAAPGAFAGAPASMLFLQGTADPVVPMAVSRAAWKQVPWPKAYVLLRRNSHSTYLQPGDLGYPTMKSTVIDFLRWTLNGDEPAAHRLPRMVYPGPTTRR